MELWTFPLETDTNIFNVSFQVSEAAVTLNSWDSRLCIWVDGRWTLHAAYRQRSDPATQWTVCIRGEKKGGERGGGKKEEEAEIRLKITWGECAGDRNEGRVRWGGVKHELCEIWKWKGAVIRTSCRDKAEQCERKTVSERRGKDGRECWRSDEVWRDDDSLQWW